MSKSFINESVNYFFENGYAWPGGYPMYGVMQDGECLCKGCTDENKKLVIENTDCKLSDCTDTSWRMTSAEINYEDSDLYCCNCGKKIETAYNEEESE